MRIFILTLFLLCSLQVFGKDCGTYDNLSPLQKGRLLFSYHQGQSTNLGYTLAAIALIESSAGLYRLNIYSRDLGLYQVNIKTASKVLGVTNYYKKLELAEKLIYRDILNAYVAIDVLRYFIDYHNQDWRKTIQSYNEGFNINTEKSLLYLDKVSGGVRLLQQCMNTTT